MRRSLSWLCLLLLPAVSLAQTAPEGEKPPITRQLSVKRATSDIKVDGRLDEQAWADALVFDLPYEWSPGDNVPPPVKTDVLVTFDDHYLYAAFKAYDPNPAEIRAHLMDRDAVNTLVQDDHVLLMVDPFNDERRGFQFRINPLGVQADSIFSQQDGVEDWSFDMIWDSAGRITGEGYIVEMAVPLNQIRYPRTSGVQTWGFDVGRSYPRSVRHRMAVVPHARGNICILCQVAKITGFESLKPGLNLELTPTITANRTDEARFGPAGPGSLENGDEHVDAGLTARWGVTPSVTLSAAVNPDFSQVEADVAQLNVNERFALFFPEKRPFFLEGIDFFSTPFDAVFTRTVVDPKWGVKVTGKEGANAFGVFATQDDVTDLLIPTNQQTFFARQDEPVTTSVLRYRRDVGAAATLGVLYTGREGTDYHNRVAGLDGFARINLADTLRVQYLRSDTRYPGGIASGFGQPLDAFQGDAFIGAYDHNGRNWSWQLAYEDRASEFRADAGFIPRVDIREGRAYLQRQFYGERGRNWYTQINTGFQGRRTEDHSGQLTDEQLGLFTTVAGPLQSFVEVDYFRNKELFQGVLYEGMNRGFVAFNIQPGAVARIGITAQAGDTVDHDNNQPADDLVIAPNVELKLGRHLNARVDHTLQRLNVDAGRLFEANLSQLRLIYNFNVRSFVRGIFQYLDLDQAVALYQPDLQPFIDPKTETFFTQLLFSYKLNPQTVLFLGYSDNRLGLQSFDLTQTDRTFFFKVGYAFVM
ncbi:MAG: DUF5916 domain-containing protein [Thermoanaerobaculia bacterium]